MVTVTEQKQRKTKGPAQLEAEADEARKSAGRTRPFPMIPLPAGVDMSRSTDPAGAIRVEVPFVVSTKYAQREVHSRLDAPQAETLRGIFEGLEVRHARLANGQRVATPQDAFRWLLEAVAASAR